jgi:glycosyltransferase involved in cell wall biosynthesis
MGALPRNEYSIDVVYSDPVWRKHLQFDNVTSTYVRKGLWGKVLGDIWIMTGLSIELWRRVSYYFYPIIESIVNKECDLWLFPSQDSFTCQVPVHALGTIHDLNHQSKPSFPELSGNGRFRYRERYLSEMCKVVEGVVVSSDVTKRRVHESYRMPRERIFVVPYIPAQYILENKTSQEFALKDRLPDKYIFYPAQFWRHKNHIRLIRAISILRSEFGDIRVVLVGSKKNGYVDVLSEVVKLGLQNHVHIMGYVCDKDMPELYRRARALIMPTFGGPTNIPPLEAFALGCPVAISDICSEQVADAALLFSPNSVDEIADSIRRLWSDDGLCKLLIARGRQRAAAWGETQFNQVFCNIIQTVLARQR